MDKIKLPTVIKPSHFSLFSLLSLSQISFHFPSPLLSLNPLPPLSFSSLLTFYLLSTSSLLPLFPLSFLPLSTHLAGEEEMF